MENVANMQIITKEVTIKNHILAGKEFIVNPLFYKRTGKSDDSYFTELKVEILNREESPFPIDLSLTIMGIFKFVGELDQCDIEKFLNLQAVQILFPYLRTMVTNLTSSILMAPLILPIIDVAKLFPNNDPKEK